MFQHIREIICAFRGHRLPAVSGRSVVTMNWLGDVIGTVCQTQCFRCGEWIELPQSADAVGQRVE